MTLPEDFTFVQGKVKTIFALDEPDKVLIQYEDKVTAGNGKKEAHYENKGEVCCKISELLFKKIEEAGIKTHYVSMPTYRAMACKKVDIIPIEVVVRNVAAGSIVRQTTLEEGHIINWPLVEWYLKDDEKDDPLLTVDRINLMGDYPLKELEYLAREVNAILKNIFDQIGLTLVDFKLEFGYDSGQNLLLADELSPDGMRLWKKDTNERFDKDLFRKDEGDIVEAYQYILQQLEQFI
jgi:phosphoribosylaminoimidazole-succinocarboxamide synthase